MIDGLIGVVIAGGLGTRMSRCRPDVPKPLVAVGGVPLIELAVRSMATAGIRDIRLALRHDAERIIEYFRTRGPAFAELGFSIETEPLGTIGALAPLKREGRPVLARNGDLLSGIHLGDLLAAHAAGGADLTIATHDEHHRLKLGEVIVGEGASVVDYVEKPVKTYRISSGTYVVGPRALELLVEGEWLPFPDFVRRAIAAGLRVRAHAHQEPWIDVNDEADLRRAEEMVRLDPVAFGFDPNGGERGAQHVS